ncbi:MAG TPA: tRNA pseudouridine(38-40) synthase TruA [Rickettsiales bacterium]|nr:tRNA pseudouridine(38-40) synthase TruA [Rickettsiales bacterium]
MPRFKLTIEYDGTGLAGWQKQKDRPSIQGYLEEAVAKLSGEFQEVTGAGRTDAGVHATGQVAHVDITRSLTGYHVMHGINYHLQPLTSQVAVVAAEEADPDFHARFSAKSRSYFYRIINRQSRLALDLTRAWHIAEPLNVGAMHEAAQLLLGHHDFTTFRSSICQAKSPLKTLDRLDVVKIGEEIHIYVQARSFLHNQVRNLVGTLRLIGNAKWDSVKLLDALAAKDRRAGGETAPPQGLYLTTVAY